MTKKGQYYVQLERAMSSEECGPLDEGEEDECIDMELSVVRKGSHGDRSWGWPDDDKIILLEGVSYSQHIIDAIMPLAQQLADTLNSRDSLSGG